MKKVTWEEILASDRTHIDLIGYGSILNKNTHEGSTSYTDTVIVHGFKRIYNLKMVPEGFCKQKLKSFMEKYWWKYGITTMEQVAELEKQNYCVLNAICTNDSKDFINGILTHIPRADFEMYQKREEIYDLYETPYYSIDPISWEIQKCHKHGFILSAHSQYLIENGHSFPPYHTLARNGAYDFWESFWKLFDETTFRVN